MALKHWSVEEQDRVRRLRSRGCTVRHIAAELGRSIGSVIYLLSCLSLRKNFTDYDFIRVASRPHTISELVVLFKLTRAQVNSKKWYLRNKGIPVVRATQESHYHTNGDWQQLQERAKQSQLLLEHVHITLSSYYIANDVTVKQLLLEIESYLEKL